MDARKLIVRFPEHAVSAEVTLADARAPVVASALWDSLAGGLRTSASHGCFDGHAVLCFLEEMRPTTVENCTMRPTPGDVMFYRAPANAFDWLYEDAPRLAPLGTQKDALELSFIYGPVHLTHHLGAALYGSLVGRVTKGFDAFAGACEELLVDGATQIEISRWSDEQDGKDEDE